MTSHDGELYEPPFMPSPTNRGFCFCGSLPVQPGWRFAGCSSCFWTGRALVTLMLCGRGGTCNRSPLTGHWGGITALRVVLGSSLQHPTTMCFGLCEEAGVPREKWEPHIQSGRTRKFHTEKPQLGFKPGTHTEQGPNFYFYKVNRSALQDGALSCTILFKFLHRFQLEWYLDCLLATPLSRLPDINPISSMTVEMCLFFFIQAYFYVSLDLHKTKVPASSPCHMQIGDSSLNITLIQSSAVHDSSSSAHCNLVFFSLGVSDG